MSKTLQCGEPEETGEVLADSALSWGDWQWAQGDGHPPRRPEPPQHPAPTSAPWSKQQMQIWHAYGCLNAPGNLMGSGEAGSAAPGCTQHLSVSLVSPSLSHAVVLAEDSM